MDRLVERVDKLREEIAVYEAQMSAQNTETAATKDALSEAHMEIEVYNFSIVLNSVVQWKSPTYILYIPIL